MKPFRVHFDFIPTIILISNTLIPGVIAVDIEQPFIARLIFFNNINSTILYFYVFSTLGG